MEAAPDPIVHYDMTGRVIYINPAFARVFGWSLEECKGRKMDHFVPDACWPETKVMIHQVRVGQGIFNVETRRLTKNGRVVDVSISGASAFDAQGKLSGSIIILRDITRSKNLEKTGDAGRGPGTHEDRPGASRRSLSPSYWYFRVGRRDPEDLKVRHDPAADLAGKMGVLMEDAVEKTRQLARRGFVRSIWSAVDFSLPWKRLPINMSISRVSGLRAEWTRGWISWMTPGPFIFIILHAKL